MLFLRYWNAIDQDGGWLMGQFSLFVLKKLSVNVAFDILGTTSQYQKEFFSKYGSNDRLSLGVRYEF